MSGESVNTVQVQHWMERIRQGDAEARNELIRSVCRRLELMAHRMLAQYPRVQRWADTGDVLQNSLMRLLRSLEEVEIESLADFFGLAATQIRRELIDLARRYSGPVARNQRELPKHDPAVADESSHLDRWTAFHEAVETLPTREREVMGLIYYHDWSQLQVAELFEVDVRTVRRWWQSALRQLHHVMKDLLPPN